MRHPEILILPVLMLADYYLTLLGAKMGAAQYQSHFKSPSYELNPVWRGDVAKQRLFNPRHLLLAAALTAILWWAGEDSNMSDWFFPFLFGMVLGALTPIIAQHLGNLFMFNYLRRNPGELDGVVTYSMRYAIVVSISHGFVTLVAFALAAGLTQSVIAYGLLTGACILMLARFSWLARAKKA